MRAKAWQWGVRAIGHNSVATTLRAMAKLEPVVGVESILQNFVGNLP